MTGYVKTVPPHIRASDSVPGMMWKTLAALVPAVAASFFAAGWNALRILIVSLAAAGLSEILARRWFFKKPTLEDGSAAVMAILLALLLPATLPTGMVMVGSFAAIFLGKELFGGLGANPFNPALVGFAFLAACFPEKMQPVPSITWGETISTAAILTGAAILWWQKLIFWEIPLLYLAALFCFSFFAGPDAKIPVISGVAFLAAFFLITDPVTTPMTRRGMRIFCLAAAVTALLLNPWCGSREAVVFSILAMNAVTPWLDRWSRPVGSRLVKASHGGGL